MYPGRVARASAVWDECDEAQGAETPTELQQAPRQPATPTGRAKRYRYAIRTYWDHTGITTGCFDSTQQEYHAGDHDASAVLLTQYLHHHVLILCG